MLLLMAALADLETARRAWQEWSGRQHLSLADQTEVRLLAAVARRMPDLVPGGPPDPLLAGSRRHIWTRTQMTLATTRPLLAALQAAGLRLMLIKGAARVAADPDVAKERALRDIDVLIHPEDWHRGIDLALGEGWIPVNDVEDRSTLSSGHAIGLTSPVPGALGSFDLHRFVLRECRNHGQDLGIWERAQRTSLQGIEVLVPVVTDQALITLGQAMLYSPGPHAPHWALDVAPMIRAGRIDWDLLVREVAQRRVEMFVAAPLLMLQECLHCPVPPEIMRWLTRPMGEAYLLEFETRATAYNPSHPETFEAVRVAAAARAMRVARHLPATARAPVRDRPPILRHAELGPGGVLEIPVPAVAAPFERLRLEISFRVRRARSRACLRLDAPGLPLKLVPVARSRSLQGPWMRRRVVLHCPAALFALRDIKMVRLRTSKRLDIRDVVVRWGPPLAAGPLRKLLAAVRPRG